MHEFIILMLVLTHFSFNFTVLSSSKTNASIRSKRSINYVAQDQQITVELGQNYSFECASLNSNGVNVTYWLKSDPTKNISTVIDPFDLSNTNKYLIQRNQTNGLNSSLTIFDFQLDDIALYICFGQYDEWYIIDTFTYNYTNLNQTCLITKCSCEYDQTVNIYFKLLYSINCRNRNLTDSDLALSYSNIYSSINLYKNFTIYNLAVNSITRIKQDYFSYFYNLIQLDLSFNKIQIIEDGSFSNLNYLKILNLNDNLIKSISKLTLNGLSQITQITLTNNRNYYNVYLDLSKVKTIKN